MPLVLIVDDSAFVRFVLKDRFRSRGWESYAAASGAEALEALSRMAPDLVTMDVVMPGLSGVETVSAIRERWAGRLSWSPPRPRVGRTRHGRLWMRELPTLSANQGQASRLMRW
jgi:CheY-like chemotaxis protein